MLQKTFKGISFLLAGRDSHYLLFFFQKNSRYGQQG